MERGGDDAHRVTALNPAFLEGEASELNSVLQEGGSEEAEEADAATAAAAARPLAASTPTGGDVARHVVVRWRAFVAERKGVFLRRLLALPDLLDQEVLKWLDPVDRTMLAQVGRPWLAAVLASGVPRSPTGATVRLRLREFCTSVERLAWAKANGCPWGEELGVVVWGKWYGWNNPCVLAAEGGYLKVLQFAREHHCLWDEATSDAAAIGGHLEVLQWAQEHGCPWAASTCGAAAAGGHLHVLRWLRKRGCPWDVLTCSRAAAGGHLDVLIWAREHHCPWNAFTCSYAAEGGHLEVLRWAHEHGCPWDGNTITTAARCGCGDTIQYVVDNGCPTEWILYWSESEGESEGDSENESVSESDTLIIDSDDAASRTT